MVIRRVRGWKNNNNINKTNFRWFSEMLLKTKIIKKTFTKFCFVLSFLWREYYRIIVGNSRVILRIIPTYHIVLLFYRTLWRANVFAHNIFMVGVKFIHFHTELGEIILLSENRMLNIVNSVGTCWWQFQYDGQHRWIYWYLIDLAGQNFFLLHINFKLRN